MSDVTTVPRHQYNWKRFWCPWQATPDLLDGGYLADPEGPYGRYLGSDLRRFEELSDFPCLALLGEPGIGKTTAMRAEWKAVEVRAEATGDETIWMNLGAYGSEERLVRKLFGSGTFGAWKAGDHRLHVFLDGLDECRLLMANVVSLLVEELAEQPVGRLSLRIGCRTAEWPTTLEEGMNGLWGEGSVGVYELAPLRRADVAVAAEVPTFLGPQGGGPLRGRNRGRADERTAQAAGPGRGRRRSERRPSRLGAPRRLAGSYERGGVIQVLDAAER